LLLHLFLFFLSSHNGYFKGLDTKGRQSHETHEMQENRHKHTIDGKKAKNWP
jgi:hypothetical protein